MKQLLAILAVVTAVAPVSAQPLSNRSHSLREYQGPAVNMYGAEHYQPRPSQQDFNPDFQLGGNRS
jgi:hypothetical protein